MPGYRWHIERLSSAKRRSRVRSSGGKAVTQRAFCDALRADAGFVDGLIRQLAAADFEAYLWETPPANEAARSQPLEFVLIDCPALARAADPQPFAAAFAATTSPVARFANLGGDAELLAPTPMSERADYAHIGAFSRTAPREQQHALWRAVGDAMHARVGTDPVWLSTSGLGVAWLHVRLDDRPKYYEHAPYRAAPHRRALS